MQKELIHGSTSPGQLGRVLYTFSSGKPDLRIFFPGDWHLGNVGADVPRLKRLMTHIADQENYFLVPMGDLTESAFRNSKGVEAGQTMTPIDQHEAVREILEEIKPRVLALVIGNHDLRWVLEGAGSPVKSLGNLLGVPAVRRLEMGIKFGSHDVFRITAHHGDRIGSPAAMKDFLNASDADLGILADKHEKEEKPMFQYALEGVRKRYVLRSSSFLVEDAYSVSLGKRAPEEFAIPYVVLNEDGRWKVGFWKDDEWEDSK